MLFLEYNTVQYINLVELRRGYNSVTPVGILKIRTNNDDSFLQISYATLFFEEQLHAHATFCCWSQENVTCSLVLVLALKN